MGHRLISREERLLNWPISLVTIGAVEEAWMGLGLGRSSTDFEGGCCCLLGSALVPGEGE
jgi:hypothetical protein